jgi:parvulin-like peptidyl-prolyl isomerase
VALGPRVRCRVIVVREADEALALRGRLESQAASGAGLIEAFAREARARSIDATASQGGLLEAVSPSDPLLPPALGLELARLAPMQVSGVIALDGSFAVAVVEEAIPAEASPSEEAIAAAERRAWLRKSRGLMEQAARDLMAQHSFTVLDESLRWNQPGR